MTSKQLTKAAAKRLARAIEDNDALGVETWLPVYTALFYLKGE